ncbi:MAG: hydantoinase/carbamoylase family amidase, partial [Synergistaceae bacterium]|nr:hydantoinase/carbamoylase family amidase [Synergistaceae bacterium]
MESSDLNRLRISRERLENSIKEMGAIGFDPVTNGRTRLALTDKDKEGRDLLCRWMRDEGLGVKIDEIGNIFGVREGSDPSALPVMMGSHIDTVRDAGMFDGAYGVLGALEVIRTLNDNNVKTGRPVIAAAFTNEEGARFQPDMMGSIYYTRTAGLEELTSSRDDSGVTVGEELDRIGYRGTDSVPVGCYLELHVEQGPRLHAEGVQIGVVEGIQGLAWWTGEYCGE